MPLPNDICRCDSLGCPIKYLCARSIDKGTGDVHHTVFEWHMNGDAPECANFIEPQV